MSPERRFVKTATYFGAGASCATELEFNRNLDCSYPDSEILHSFVSNDDEMSQHVD